MKLVITLDIINWFLHFIFLSLKFQYFVLFLGKLLGVSLVLRYFLFNLWFYIGEILSKLFSFLIRFFRCILRDLHHWFILCNHCLLNLIFINKWTELKLIYFLNVWINRHIWLTIYGTIWYRDLLSFQNCLLGSLNFLL